MASFQAKLRGETVIKTIVLLCSNPTRNRKFQKNSKKKKITILGSFQAKIGWERPRKSENENYRSVSFLPDA